MESVRNEEVAIPADIPRQLHPELMQILMGMLTKDPARRLTLPQLIANPWLNAP